MRITIVQGPFLPVPPLRGGAVEKIWFALAKEFARRGHTVTQISRRFPGLANDETIEGIRNIRVGGFNTPPSWRVAGVDLLWSLRPVLDLIYSIRARTRLPEGDVVVTNAFWLPVLIRPGARCGRLYIHVQRYPKSQVRWYTHAARLQTVSSSLARTLKAMLPECTERVRVIANPMLGDIGWKDERELEKRLDARERVVLYVGRIHPAKGLKLLVEAFARFQKTPGNDEWSLRLVGPSESALGGGGSGFRRQLAELGRSFGTAVNFVGFLDSPESLREEYSRAQIFVYPTLDEFGEASPLAPLEAMSCGCTVVTSRLDCFQGYLVDGETGFTFDQRSPDPVGDLANVLERLAGDTDLRKSVAVKGWRSIQKLSVAQIACLYLADFEELTPARNATQKASQS